MTATHDWKFFRAGGFDQVRIDRGADIAALDQLDQKLWVALACPVKGLEVDEATLALLDTDGDGRIRAPEVIAAAKWVTSVLKDPDALVRGDDAVVLSNIDASTAEGARILASAKKLLSQMDKPDADRIALADVADTAKAFAASRFNGDGVIPPTAAQDEALEAFVKDILATVGGVDDRVGAKGVDQATLDKFMAEVRAYTDWWASAEGDASKLPLGDATAAAAAAVEAVRAKVDDYFTRTHLAAFDGRSAAALNRADSDWQAISGDLLTAGDPRVAGFPLAHIAADKPLPLGSGVNPAWAGKLQTLRDAAVKPLLGDRTTLTQADWDKVTGRVAAYQAWAGTKAGASVESLGLDKLRAYLAGDLAGQLAALIAQDLALKPEADAIDAVYKLVRLQRDYHRLLENFVNFRRFYSKQEKALFQTGTLYLDNRSCDLVMRVDNAAKHGTLAGLSRCYLAYLDCTRRGSGDKRTIAAVFSDGDVDFLMVGRNGVFYDRAGNDWDATITKVVENPLSIRQAFWSPYKKVVRSIESQVQKAAEAREKASQAKLEGAVANTQAAATAPADAKPAPFDIAKFAGIFAAIGLAVGALMGVLGWLFTTILGLTWWQIPIAIAVILLIISGPSMLLAALKLRQRNLGPILEANGWAINARARINIPFGRSLTHLAKLPEGAEFSKEDPFAEKKPKWPWVLLVLAVLGITAYILYDQGYFTKWFGA
ncbi:MAG: hypothetical protein EP329_06825 [Deltaproteobacteria bacterium]|nr:MAG: hypothetical protein EP329_06825 [Deltaproteobacteria bacterium]